MTSYDLQEVRLDKAVREQTERLAKLNIEFVPWGIQEISRLLKSYPVIVDDFFGRSWVKVFCGDQAAESLAARSRAKETGQQQSDGESLGRPIADISARELRVHRAIRHDDTTNDLPIYVTRPHDAELGVVVDAAMACRSGIAILVSDSTSGKTRACYESLSRLVADTSRQWRIWPTASTSAEVLLDRLPRVAPGTVVWLDEVRQYLLDPPTPVAEGIATELLKLLGSPTRGPVLVLGTLWPQLWDLLAYKDVFADLLEGCEIRVPDTFSEGDCAAGLATGDPRLEEAVRHAAEGAVTQYLAGVPQLMDRYHNAVATPGARGLVHAAMDARRLGHDEWIPGALLVAAGIGYADAREQRKLARKPEWAAAVLPSLTWLGRGDISVLHPSAAGDSQAEPSYRLEDYLEQHGRRVRADELPPAAFWDACLWSPALPSPREVEDHADHLTDLSKDLTPTLPRTFSILPADTARRCWH